MRFVLWPCTVWRLRSARNKLNNRTEWTIAMFPPNRCFPVFYFVAIPVRENCELLPENLWTTTSCSIFFICFGRWKSCAYFDLAVFVVFLACAIYWMFSCASWIDATMIISDNILPLQTLFCLTFRFVLCLKFDMMILVLQ